MHGLNSHIDFDDSELSRFSVSSVDLKKPPPRGEPIADFCLASTKLLALAVVSIRDPINNHLLQFDCEVSGTFPEGTEAIVGNSDHR